MNSFTQHGTSIALYAVCFVLAAILAGLAQIFGRSYRSAELTPSFTQRSRPNRIFWVLSLIIPLLLASFRWQVGTDYSTYIYLYDLFSEIETLSQFFRSVLDIEPSFIILNVLIKAIFNDYILVFAICSLITLAFFYRAIEDYHEKSSVMLAIVVFLFLLYPTTLNIVRQMIAVAIVFYATRYIFQRKYAKAAIWMIVALSFHYSALMILPFWFLRGDRRWQKNIRIVLFALLIFIVVGDLVFHDAFSQLPLFGLLADTTTEGTRLSYGLLLLRLPIIVPVLVFRKRLIAQDERNYYWIILMVFEVAFGHLGYIFDVFNRFALYFAVSWVVLLPALVRCMRTRGAQYRMGAYVLLATVGLWVYNTGIQNYGDVLPYKSIFDAYFSGVL